MLRGVAEKIKERVKQRLVLSYLIGKLETLGVTVRLDYLTQEYFLNDEALIPKPELERTEPCLLSSSDIKVINDHPESKWLRGVNAKLSGEGCPCFALKSNDEILTYMWFHLSRCPGPHPFTLKEDEAYISGAFTFRKHRGKNLAPFLRYHLYKHLNQLGRTKIYSLTDVLNTPAIKFKKKLRAKPVKIIVSIELFDKYNWSFIIRAPKQFVETF